MKILHFFFFFFLAALALRLFLATQHTGLRFSLLLHGEACLLAGRKAHRSLEEQSGQRQQARRLPIQDTQHQALATGSRGGERLSKEARPLASLVSSLKQRKK